MVNNILDLLTINLPCECGKETPKTVAWLKKHDGFVCDCGTMVRLSGDGLLREIANAEKSIEELQATVNRLNKTK